MARCKDPAFAKAIGADVAETANLDVPGNVDEPMTLASVLDNSKASKFFPTKFCILSYRNDLLLFAMVKLSF